MNSTNASEAGEKLYRLLDETARDHEPVFISGSRSNAVLLGRRGLELDSGNPVPSVRSGNAGIDRGGPGYTGRQV
jgi:hypothetical protein